MWPAYVGTLCFEQIWGEGVVALPCFSHDPFVAEGQTDRHVVVGRLGCRGVFLISGFQWRGGGGETRSLRLQDLAAPRPNHIFLFLPQKTTSGRM